MKEKYTFDAENVSSILKDEVGNVFSQVLTHAGVYKCNEEGKAAFLKFVDSVNNN